MKKITAIQNSIRQAFWQKYPYLGTQQGYRTEDLLDAFYSDLKASEKELYARQLYALVETGELPLIPIIPLGNSKDDYAVNFY